MILTPPQADDAKTPEELFAMVDQYIDAVHNIIERREFLELNGLDNFIDYLCKRVLALTPEEAQRYKPQLDGLMADMDDLQAHLQAAKQSVRGDIDQLNKQSAAAKAYKKQDK